MKILKFRPSSLLFYITIIIITAIALLFIIGTEKNISDLLYDYEYSQAKYKVEDIFNEYFSKPDAQYLISLTDAPSFNAPDTLQTATDKFKSKFENAEITYSYVAGSDRKIINVKANGEKFARFSIKPSDEKSKYGFSLYELDKITLYYDTPAESAVVKIPFFCTAYADGMELTDEYLKEDNIIEDSRVDIPEGAYLFTYKRYSVSGLYNKPLITVKDGEGNEKSLSYDEEKDEYYYSYEYSEALQAEYGDYVIAAIKAYSAYMQNDSRFRDVRDYFDSTTQLYQGIYENPGSFVWEHDGYRFENESASRFYDYGGVISCRVKIDHILEKENREDYTDVVDLILYLRVVDGVYKIYHMTSNILPLE